MPNQYVHYESYRMSAIVAHVRPEPLRAGMPYKYDMWFLDRGSLSASC